MNVKKLIIIAVVVLVLIYAPIAGAHAVKALWDGIATFLSHLGAH